jgi:dTDP-glucose pyrophosphorylase/predicted transcriptional regulator
VIDKSMNSWHSCLLEEDSTIAQAVASLNKSGLQIVIVHDQNKEFIGTITDGDIRRALLNKFTIDSSINSIINRSALTVNSLVPENTLKALMQERRIHQIPIVDVGKNILGLHLWDNLNQPSQISNTMVIMAGGKGSRLRPLTDNIPKPMIQVNNEPMLEKIILRAKSQGIMKFVLTLNYLADQIMEYFKDGSKFEVSISYIVEREPLGTAGSLKLLENMGDLPFLVTNADVLTDTNYVDLLNFHEINANDLTIAVKTHEWTNPFGVVKIDGLKVLEYIEKPMYSSTVNAGIYCLNPKVLNLMETNQYLDMSELIEKSLESRMSIGAYGLYEKWLDVGRKEDLQKANLEGSP